MVSETLLVSLSMFPFFNEDVEREDFGCVPDEANGALGGSRGVFTGKLGNIGYVEPAFERVESAESLGL